MSSSIAPTVIKRDGSERPFDITRIENAIAKASSASVPTLLSPSELARKVQREIVRLWPVLITVEVIQDIVESILMQEGEIEVARHYILYRAEHAKQRQERDIPAGISALFDESSQYFPTPLQQFQFYDKYSRYDENLGRRETWVETVDRSVAFLRELVQDQIERTRDRHDKRAKDLPEETWVEIRQAILEMRVMPSMRLLAMAGPAARRQNLAIYNCFSGDTTFVTREGIKSLEEMVGQKVEVMTTASWRQAEVKSFGKQQIQRVRLRHWTGKSHGNVFHEVYVTPNHRWLLLDGTETTDLRVGDKLASPMPYMDDVSQLAPIFESGARHVGSMHGFIYGDGTITRNGDREYVQVRLCGKKRHFLDTIFAGMKHSLPPSYDGDPVVYCGKHIEWKSLPENPNARYAGDFIYGLMCADGSKINKSENYRIDTQNAELVDWLFKYAALAGYKILSHRVYDNVTNYGKRSAPLHQIALGRGESAILRVESIELLNEAEVFCAVEPDTHTFMLGNGQITGNCSAIGIDSIEAFVEALLISMAGCGVGFSVERRFVDKLPTIAQWTGNKNSEPLVQYEGASELWPLHVVEDTTEGWANALRLGLETWFAGGDIRFDFSLVRPAGAVLKTKGGRASGPEPLKKLLREIRWIIIRKRGQKLRPIDAHDIMCHVGSAAVSGGTRRTAMISLFDADDQEMLHAKDGDLTKQPQRWNANNSAVWPERGITQREFIEQMLSMDKAGTGEPGIFNRTAIQQTQPRHRKQVDFLTNPCGEVTLRPDGGLCNLSICVARPDDTYETLKRKVELATIIGTIQSLATHFPGLREQWRRNAEEERLLGVDITGQRDCPVVQSPSIMVSLRDSVYETNVRIAELFQINQSASTTVVKPSGNSSVLLNCSSGIHARWAPYYIRNVRVGATTPIYKVLRDAGVPMQPEVGQTAENAITWVASFPVKSPDGALTRNDLPALEQCVYWLQNKLYWTTHNPSVTITYRPDELLDLIKWVWERHDLIGGMSFLPRDDAQYNLMPYQEITEERYKELVSAFPAVDYAKLYRYEQSDMSTAAQELSCFAGQCEIA